MKSHRTSECVLGIAATGRAVHAVLIQNGLDGPEVVRRFSRQRSRAGTPTSPAMVGAMADIVTEPVAAQDFTIQFGDSGGKDLFLASEFGGLDKEGGDDPAGSAALAQTFELELRDLLDECRDAGYTDPVIAFALPAADISFVEVRLPESKGRKSDREALIDLLTQQFKGLFEEERVAFVAMTTGDEGGARSMAVFPKLADPVSATLRSLREEKERLPAVRLLDSEVSLYVGLGRLAQRQILSEPPPEEHQDDADAAFSFAPPGLRGFVPPAEGQPLHTLIVRAGFEDTLVLFMRGETVHHCESLRSLTAFDAPETVCSRVLLQQDEHGVGDVHHVLLLSEEREQDLIETFEMFFPDARVESVRDYLPHEGGAPEVVPTAVVSATAAAIRLLGDEAYEGLFEPINFLPKKLAGRRVYLPFNLLQAMLAVLTVVTTLFFITTYSKGADEIESYRTRINHLTDGNVSTDIHSLQASIDSMQNVHQTYLRALQVLDTLLIGSDRWSRALELTAREAAVVKGVWIESMVPAGTTLQIIGTATSRERIVAFATRLGATIETLTFSEIREWPVYSYHMRVDVQDELPAAAHYLREQVELPDHTPPTGTAAPTPKQP